MSDENSQELTLMRAYLFKQQIMTQSLLSYGFEESAKFPDYLLKLMSENHDLHRAEAEKAGVSFYLVQFLLMQDIEALRKAHQLPLFTGHKPSESFL